MADRRQYEQEYHPPQTPTCESYSSSPDGKAFTLRFNRRLSARELRELLRRADTLE